MADTILMIHGAWGGPWCWREYAGFFETRGYDCLTPALRYHDISPDAEPPPELGRTSILDYVDDLVRLVQERDVQPIIMGHSMGGLLAQLLASRVEAKALVLLAPAPPAGIWMLGPSMMRAYLSILATWRFWRRPVRQTFSEAAYGELNMLPADEQRQTYARFVCESGRAIAELGLWFLDRRGAARVDSSRIRCPVLAIAAEQDHAVPPRVVRQVASRYAPMSTYREFPGHGHMVLSEPGREGIAGYVGEWVEQICTRQSESAGRAAASHHVQCRVFKTWTE